MILSKTTTVRITKRNIDYYKSVIGDSIKTGDIFEIPIDNLFEKSTIKVRVKCDYCGTEFEREYKEIIKGRQFVQKDACINCRSQKYKEVNLLKYGVENVMQVPEIRERLEKSIEQKYGVYNVAKLKETVEKRRATNIERYGCKNPMMNKDVRLKAQKTNIERYGATTYAGSEEGRKRITHTNMEKYGVEWPFQNSEIQRKVKETFIEKYGVNSPLSDPNVRKKIRDTIYEKYGGTENFDRVRFGNDIIPSSKQQRALAWFYSCELNKQIGIYYADLCFENEKIIIEYDGSGHNISVLKGRFTQEQFVEREKTRTQFFLEQGYKVARIINTCDSEIDKDFALKIKNIIFNELENKNLFTYTIEQ